MPRACLAAAFAVLYLLAPVFCSDAAARGPLRILTLGLMDTMSHHKFMSTLTVELARRGHLVTSVDVAMPKDVPATLNVSVIETAFSAWPDNLIDEWHDISAFRQILLVHQFGVLECEDLRAPTIRRLIESDLEFDLLVIDHTAECMLGFAHRFGYPGVVLVSPFPGYIDDLMGVPPLPGVLPIMSQPFPLPMGLWQRAATLVLQAWSQGCDWWYRSEQDRYLREAFGPDVPSTIELRRAVHLALINESPGAVEVARPLPPSVIPVGGLHVKPANISNIPADLLSWLEEAKTGFVFVSFGSLIKGEHVGNAKLATMAESFGALGPAVRVLWKTERLGATALPPNVRTGEWLPQNDLLGHPKMLLFVSHCGGLSTSEASHHGMPVLGVPFLADQFLNAEKLLQHGSGRYISFEGITKKLFVSEIKEMIENPKYRRAAKHTADLLRDQKEGPLQRAVWWLEYVGRRRGAPHLRSPLLDVHWHQAVLLDVIALLFVAVILLAALAFIAARAARRFMVPLGKSPLRVKTD